MSARTSELMMDLLKEMALLKQLEDDYEKGPKSDLKHAESDARKSRRSEICEQMKALAETAS
jgi:hypothetical protein